MNKNFIKNIISQIQKHFRGDLSLLLQQEL